MFFVFFWHVRGFGPLSFTTGPKEDKKNFLASSQFVLFAEFLTYCICLSRTHIVFTSVVDDDIQDESLDIRHSNFHSEMLDDCWSIAKIYSL